jgi:8-hydroxy-5-deazaflavin:NADPH oxidoreductase
MTSRGRRRDLHAIVHRPHVSRPFRQFHLVEFFKAMTTAIIGAGHLGSALAQHLVRGSERVVLAAEDESHAQQVATELGPLASAAPVREAISQADTVVLALWLDKLRPLVAEQSDLLNDKVVVDPTNPIGFDENGNFMRTLPEHQSSGSVVAGLLPPRSHYVKAFGTLSAVSLASSANRTPRRVALYYATDDDQAAATVERLISAAGFDPVKAGGLQAAGRIETPGGDLQESGLGRLVDADEARAAIAAATAE